ncbi:MAG: Fur family transcriptional regulator [Myxococcota bacterium]|nr:Fur family transcriptional regulator [Myxococcota bacterium]
MAHELEQKALADYLEDHNLKHTKQREAILSVFLDVSGHITSEDLHKRVRELHPGIGYTTVYRTMKLLCEAGLAMERNFDDGVTRYEVEHEHHDHLVCTSCGKIVEFECQMIESAQNDIVERYGFRLLRHRHELYGHCPSCQARDRKKSNGG